MLILEQSKMNQDRDEFNLLLEQKDRVLNDCLEKLRKNASMKHQEVIKNFKIFNFSLVTRICT